MSRVFELYGIPVFETYIADSRLNLVQNELGSAIEDLKNNNAFGRPKQWVYQDTHNVSDPSFSTNFLDKYDLKQVKEEIRIAVCDYLQALRYTGMYQYRIGSSWLTLTRKGEYAHMHTHGFFDISGAYYYKTNGDDGELFFDQPQDLIRNSIFIKNIPDRMVFKPEVGKMLLFPSWFRHGVKPNPTDNERISLSFNIELRR